MDSDLEQALDSFVEHYEKSTGWLFEEYDAEWRSPCEVGSPYTGEDDRQLIRWSPQRREAADDFAGLERALEHPVHPDIKAYYGRYWAGSMGANAPDGPVQLIFLWNPEDIARLTENLIGHVISQRQSKSPFSVFFATTSPDSDYFLSVDNESGAVVLEQPGRKPLRTIAPDLASFLEELSPDPPKV